MVLRVGDMVKFVYSGPWFVMQVRGIIESMVIVTHGSYWACCIPEALRKVDIVARKKRMS